MRSCFLLLLLLLSVAAPAQRPDSVSRLIDSALNVMEHRAINSHTLNWKKLRRRVDALSRNARTDREAMPALFWAFDQLRDKHGWITVADSTHFNQLVKREKRALSPGIEAALRRGPQLYNGVSGDHYAYINVHFFGGQTEAAMNAFAQRIQDSLCKNVNAGTRGIIVDLRLNGGGNGFPMYQGLANVFGDGVFTEGVNGRGQKTGVFAIRDGRVTLHGNHNDSIVLQLQRRCGDLSRLPVAVLISGATGSSAEQLAIAFTARPNTVLIGERSAGYVTANNGFELPGTGNGIVVAEGLTRNIRGRLFSEDVRPDIEVIGGDDFVNREADAKVRAALAWLEKQK